MVLRVSGSNISLFSVLKGMSFWYGNLLISVKVADERSACATPTVFLTLI